MDTATFIIINLVLLVSWYLFFFSQKELLSFVDRIIATEMLLGILFKNLYAGPLLISNIIVSSGVPAYSHFAGVYFSMPERSEFLQFQLKWWGGMWEVIQGG